MVLLICSDGCSDGTLNTIRLLDYRESVDTRHLRQHGLCVTRTASPLH
jgi:hypothetical protein